MKDSSAHTTHECIRNIHTYIITHAQQPLSEIMQEQASERFQRPHHASNVYAPTPNTRHEVDHRMSWTRMTLDEVNQILRFQNMLLRCVCVRKCVFMYV